MRSRIFVNYRTTATTRGLQDVNEHLDALFAADVDDPIRVAAFQEEFVRRTTGAAISTRITRPLWPAPYGSQHCEDVSHTPTTASTTPTRLNERGRALRTSIALRRSTSLTHIRPRVRSSRFQRVPFSKHCLSIPHLIANGITTLSLAIATILVLVGSLPPAVALICQWPVLVVLPIRFIYALPMARHHAENSCTTAHMPDRNIASERQTADH